MFEFNKTINFFNSMKFLTKLGLTEPQNSTYQTKTSHKFNIKHQIKHKQIYTSEN